MSNNISLKGVSKFYENKKIKVLNNINYSFQKGKVYSITGPSGSGKSTLLNILSLIDTPNIGSVKISNVETNNKSSSEKDEIRSKKIGIIYQDKNLLNDFTALENIYLASLSRGNNKNKAISMSKKLTSKLRLTKRENHFPNEMSGGEVQRAAICRAVINEPEIILADEPTGNLDKNNSHQVFKLLLGLINNNRTIIYATHNTYFSNLADCKLELNDGKIKTINASNKRKKF